MRTGEGVASPPDRLDLQVRKVAADAAVAAAAEADEAEWRLLVLLAGRHPALGVVLERLREHVGQGVRKVGGRGNDVALRECGGRELVSALNPRPDAFPHRQQHDSPLFGMRYVKGRKTSPRPPAPLPPGWCTPFQSWWSR